MKSALLAAILCAATVCSESAVAQIDTTFTYQGQLNEAGAPANGTFIMQFSLFDAPLGGTQVGSTVTIADQAVSDGIFSAQVDFGAQDFSGSQYWLEIVVDGNSLSPRQAMTASPFSIQTRGLFVDANNNVGIGTNSPSYPLHVETSSIFGRGVLGAASATSGVTYGGWFESHSSSGRGVFGVATSSTGATYGVYGQTSSTSGHGVFGSATASSGTTYGVRGENASTSGRGVFGRSTAATGTTYGVYGQSSSESGSGVFGRASYTDVFGITYGGRFESVSPNGRGVYGLATHSTGATFGGRFQSDSSSGRGVYGIASSTNGLNYGVHGHTNSPSGYAGYFTGGENYFEGTVGIGTINPSAKLAVFAPAGDSAFRVQLDGSTRMLVNANGGVSLGASNSAVGAGNVYIANNLGIGTSSPTFDISVSGTAGKTGGGSWAVFSDQRLKKNINSMAGSLEIISALHPVTFEYASKDHFSYTPGVQRGFIAQEVQKVIPQWVNTADDGYLYLDQAGYEALIVDALQELRAEKDAEIEQLQARIDRLERMMTLSNDR